MQRRERKKIEDLVPYKKKIWFEATTFLKLLFHFVFLRKKWHRDLIFVINLSSIKHAKEAFNFV